MINNKSLAIVLSIAMLITVLPISLLSADGASEMIVYYDFNGNFNDQLSGSSLTLIDNIESGSGYGNATS